MFSSLLRGLMVLLGMAAAANAHAQQLPPVAGSTAEYQQAAEMFGSEQQTTRRLQLNLIACQKKDAAGCYNLAFGDEARLKDVTGMPAGATLEFFAGQALSLAQQRCAPERGVEDGCQTYQGFLSNLRGSRLGGPRILEGGRVLAKRCLAGKSNVTDCSGVEDLLWEAPDERDMLATWVDKQFETACASGDNDLCHSGFFRQWGDLTEAMALRLFKLADAAIAGCRIGAPLECAEAADFLARFGGTENYGLTAELFRAACNLAPRPGENDVRQAACKNEGIVRAEIAKGAPPKP